MTWVIFGWTESVEFSSEPRLIFGRKTYMVVTEILIIPG